LALFLNISDNSALLIIVIIVHILFLIHPAPTLHLDSEGLLKIHMASDHALDKESDIRIHMVREQAETEDLIGLESITFIPWVRKLIVMQTILIQAVTEGLLEKENITMRP
jgi:hypothetical protein